MQKEEVLFYVKKFFFLKKTKNFYASYFLFFIISFLAIQLGLVGEERGVSLLNLKSIFKNVDYIRF